MIDWRIKELFFDAPRVLSAVDRATSAVLSKLGAFVRTAAKHSIRKRKAISEPGSPPSSHVGALRRLIFFGYDPGQRSVVIGPTPFTGAAGTAEAPPLLEYGGRARRLVRAEPAVARKDRKGRTVTATYRPRPFMGPAFEQEKRKLPDLWAGAVR
jgi:hypothetical protein